MNDTNQSTLAVIVTSGGLDSCVVATLAAREYSVAMLHVRYGQRTEERETTAFSNISNAVGAVEKRIINMNYLGQIGCSSLTDPNMSVPENPDSGTPSTYVPFRNANLFAAAVSWAETLKARFVYTGINQIDSSGYPDCTEQFLNTFNQLISCGTRPDTQIQLVAPLLSMSKTQIVKLGLDINAPLHLSWSCYQNEDKACGICDSCRLRLQGFLSNNAVDPIPYQTNPFAS